LNVGGKYKGMTITFSQETKPRHPCQRETRLLSSPLTSCSGTPAWVMIIIHLKQSNTESVDVAGRYASFEPPGPTW
jgi:hypothetical protein